MNLATINTETMSEESANKEIESLKEELAQTRDKLLHAEKMASLGKLMAGIAHEVNTPIGAIRASAGSLKDTLPQTVDMLPQVYKSLDDTNVALFHKVLDRAFNAAESGLSSREERKRKKALKNYFGEQGFANSSELSHLFGDIGVHENLEEFLPLLRLDSTPLILKTIYFLVLQKKSSENIELAVEKATKMVFALTNYSRKEIVHEKSHVNLKSSIDTVLTLYRNTLKHGIEVVKHFESVPDTLCYPDELYQVWTNLVTNAVHAMSNKGRLDVYVHQAGDNIEVKIQDSGTGIDSENLEKIFEPFFTTKKAGQGTGLGLDIVKAIILKHDGKIEVESTGPTGTTFAVTLPIVEAEK